MVTPHYSSVSMASLSIMFKMNVVLTVSAAPSALHKNFSPPDHPKGSTPKSVTPCTAPKLNATRCLCHERRAPLQDDPTAERTYKLFQLSLLLPFTARCDTKSLCLSHKRAQKGRFMGLNRGKTQPPAIRGPVSARKSQVVM